MSFHITCGEGKGQKKKFDFLLIRVLYLQFVKLIFFSLCVLNSKDLVFIFRDFFLIVC